MSYKAAKTYDLANQLNKNQVSLQKKKKVAVKKLKNMGYSEKGQQFTGNFTTSSPRGILLEALGLPAGRPGIEPNPP